MQDRHRLLPGSRDVPAPNRWRTGQSMIVADWSNPASPQYVRTTASGRAAGWNGRIPNSLHGPISTHEHPNAAGMLARGATTDDRHRQPNLPRVGCRRRRHFQIVDRKKLLPPSLGGTWIGDPDRPTEADLPRRKRDSPLCPRTRAAIRALPVFGLTRPATRSSPSSSARHRSALFGSDLRQVPGSAALELHRRRDRENSKTAPPGNESRAKRMAGADGPVDDVGGSARRRRVSARELLRRGARFGVHSSEETSATPITDG